MKKINREQLNSLIWSKKGKRSIRALARDLGCSAAYISDILLNKRDPGPLVLDWLSYRKIKTTVIEYERVK